MFEARWSLVRDRLAAAAAFDLPHPFRPVLEGHPAGVLVLLGLPRESALGNGDLNSLGLLVTRRTETLATHKSQYAFPGGSRDPEDDSVVATALRETNEEMGVAPDDVEILGTLPEIWTPSGFRITPVAGLLRRPVEDVSMVPSREEIDHWFWCDLGELRDPKVYSREKREIRLAEKTYWIDVDIFQIAEHRIWGATGAILKNFIDRLDRLPRLET